MKAKIHPSILKGEVTAPPSKSCTHRALIAAALAAGTSIIKNPLLSRDILETVRALEVLGARFDQSPERITVHGVKLERFASLTLEIPASGSTLRMLVPLLTIFTPRLEIRTTPRLLERIATPDLKQLKGLDFSFQEDRLLVSGKFEARVLEIEPVLTTQWLSGAILALPFLPPGTVLKTAHPLRSPSYPALTLEVGKAFGVDFSEREGNLTVTRPGGYKASRYSVEGDWSAAANWLVAGCFSPGLRVGGLNPSSLQPDSSILPLLSAMGAELRLENGFYAFSGTAPVDAAIDVSQTPDLFPVLAAFASVRPGETRIRGLEKLKYKESDRAEKMVAGLKKIGAEIEISGGEVRALGKEVLAGGEEVDVAGDHRLLMAFTALSGKIRAPIVLDSAEGVAKSYPGFFETFVSLGGKMEKL